ncbi:EamA family transporter [bacterium]|nr:EamA family transporter [bacterium]
MTSHPPASASRSISSQVILALGVVYVVWGSTYLAIRFAVEGLPPFVMAGLRFFLAGLLMVAFGFAARHARPSGREIVWSSIIGIFLLVGGNGFVVWAEQYVSSGMAALMVATVPLWILGLEASLKGGARPAPLGLAGVLLGFGGVVTLMWPKLATGASQSLLAQGAVVLASLLWAIGSVLARRVPLPASGVYHSGISMLAGSAGFLVLSLAFGEPSRFAWASVPTSAWLALAYLVTFGSCIGFSAYAWLVRNAEPSLYSTYAYVNPVVAVMLGALLAAEPVDAWLLAGAGLIVVSVMLVIRGGRKTAR